MRRAFTLVETLIACALGVAVCAAAFSCVRIAQQSLASVQRLSTENSLMRAGMLAAFDEVDRWDALDDRSGGGPLRADGQPFHAVDWGALGVATDFAQHREALLWRGCGASHDQRRYGKYQLLANRDDADPTRAWYGRFLQGVADRIGFAALVEYAPANAVYSYVDGAGDTPDEFKDAGYPPGDPLADPTARRFYAGPCWDQGPRDIHRLTEASGFVLSTDLATAQRGFSYWDNWGDANWAGPGWDLPGLHQRARTPLALMPLAPTTWPRLEVEVRRFVTDYRNWATATIRLTSPVTGERMKLFFSSLGTTLRGARIDRGLDAGLPTP